MCLCASRLATGMQQCHGAALSGSACRRGSRALLMDCSLFTSSQPLHCPCPHHAAVVQQLRGGVWRQGGEEQVGHGGAQRSIPQPRQPAGGGRGVQPRCTNPGFIWRDPTRSSLCETAPSACNATATCNSNTRCAKVYGQPGVVHLSKRGVDQRQAQYRLVCKSRRGATASHFHLHVLAVAAAPVAAAPARLPPSRLPFPRPKAPRKLYPSLNSSGVSSASVAGQRRLRRRVPPPLVPPPSRAIIVCSCNQQDQAAPGVQHG